MAVDPRCRIVWYGDDLVIMMIVMKLHIHSIQYFSCSLILKYVNVISASNSDVQRGDVIEEQITHLALCQINKNVCFQFPEQFHLFCPDPKVVMGSL